MKSLFLSLLTLLIAAVSVTAQEDAITKYFNKYIDDTTFTSVYISPKMFNMVSKVEIKDMDPEVQQVIASMKGMRILHTDKNAPKYYQEALKAISTNEYEVLLTARDKGENVRFMVKESGDIIQELLMIVGGETDFAMISFIGNIDLKKIGKLAEALNIDNLEYLKNLDQKK